MFEFEPLNVSYDDKLVQLTIANALDAFYRSLTAALDNVDIDKVLKRKNPYLYRAKGINNATQIEETIFGNVFFEPLAIAVSGGQKAMAVGSDITVDKGGTIYNIAVKSGPSVFNRDSRKRQAENFQSAAKRAQQAKKSYVPVVGYGYGKKRIRPGQEKFYKELAGQDFWAWLAGDRDFYLKIIGYMGTKPDEYAAKFDEAYNRAENRMLREFTANYCLKDGSIDWNKLVRYNSGNGL